MMNNLLFKRQKYTDQRSDEWFGPRVRKPLEKYVVLDKNPCSAGKYSNGLKRVHILPQFHDLFYCLYRLNIDDKISVDFPKLIGMATRDTNIHVYTPDLSIINNTCELAIQPLRASTKFYLACVCFTSNCTESEVFRNPEDFCPIQSIMIDFSDIRKYPITVLLSDDTTASIEKWFKYPWDNCVAAFYFRGCAGQPNYSDAASVRFYRSDRLNYTSHVTPYVVLFYEMNENMFFYLKKKSFSRLSADLYVQNWLDFKTMFDYAFHRFYLTPHSKCPTQRFFPASHYKTRNQTQGPCFVYISVFPTIPNVDHVFPNVGHNVAPVYFEQEKFPLKLRNELEKDKCSFLLFKIGHNFTEEVHTAIHTVLECQVEPRPNIDYGIYQPLVDQVKKQVLKCPKSVDPDNYLMVDVTEKQLCGQIVQTVGDDFYQLYLNPLTEEQVENFTDFLYFENQCGVSWSTNAVICTCLPIFDCTDVRTVMRLYLLTMGKPTTDPENAETRFKI
uniref:Uncharacterized protein n=1 Tax=Panagrolaimus sp. JU765 TaxID=591449 RepID=A0AC34QD66_9BILA